jgi:hypothetical protein
MDLTVSLIVECLLNYLLPKQFLFPVIFFPDHLGHNFFDRKSCQAGLSSSGVAAELRFHVVDTVRRTKAVRIGPGEVERGITRRVPFLI